MFPYDTSWKDLRIPGDDLGASRLCGQSQNIWIRLTCDLVPHPPLLRERVELENLRGEHVRVLEEARKEKVSRADVRWPAPSAEGAPC